MSGRSTHLLELRDGVVVKAYRSQAHGEPEREWQALTLLSEHAPGLAPTPLTADLGGDPPTVTMSHLDGTPLDNTLTPEQAEGIAAVVTGLQEAIPQHALADLPARAGHPEELLQQVRTWCTTATRPRADPLAAEAFDLAKSWVHRPEVTETLRRPSRPVFGTGDGNLANFLWDGTTARLVDFEYSGRSDRAYELAELIEHASARPALAWLPDRFGLSPTEATRLTACRRLMALFWLYRLPAAQTHSQALHFMSLF